MMRARVPADYPHVVVTACAGVRFNKGEWTPIPLGLESEARKYALGGYLEIQPEAKPKPKAKPPLKRRRKAKPPTSEDS